MKKGTRSILEELNSFLPKEHSHQILESRGNHIIESAINLLEQIKKNFGDDEAQELEKRFFSSVKNRDPKRFERGIRKFKSSEE